MIPSLTLAILFITNAPDPFRITARVIKLLPGDASRMIPVILIPGKACDIICWIDNEVLISIEERFIKLKYPISNRSVVCWDPEIMLIIRYGIAEPVYFVRITNPSPEWMRVRPMR